jgi:hypothetical protein
MTDLIVGEPLVRSRYLTDKEDFHHTIQDYSYNPFPEYIKVGRANYVGQQIFYGSRFRVTSLGEVRFIYANREKNEARYSLGRWEVRDKLQLAAIVTPELIRKHNAKELFSLADFIEQTEQKYKNDQDLSGFIDIYRYMASKYTEAVQEGEEHKYINLTNMKKILLLGFLFSVTHFGNIYAQAEHPAYLHALSNLRAARWMIEHHSGNWNTTVDEFEAIKRIDKAISEIKKAAIDDGKNTKDHPKASEINEHAGRLTKALEYLRNAHADIEKEEDNEFAKGLRKKALDHINEAINLTEKAGLGIK